MPAKPNAHLIRILAPLDKHGREALARKVGTTYQYLHQLAHGHRRASVELCKRFERHTGLTRRDLRPDLFA